MNKITFLLLLLFPTLAFGQNYTGNYRAVFFNLFSEPKTIVAEFEVKSDNSINGKVKVGDEIKLFNGSVDKKGKFEAVSQIEGNSIYKLKGKFDKDNKISFIQRVQVGSGLNKSVSENGFEGSFAKVAAVVAEISKPKVPKDFPVVDNGKSQLNIQHSNPLFGNQWTDFVGKIIYKGSGDEKRLELRVDFTAEQQKRAIRIYTKPLLPNQRVWKTAQIQTASYREEKLNSDERNAFLSGDLTYQENSTLQTGTLEIVKETETQIIFRLISFRIKRLVGQDFVELNGFIYADK